MNPCVMVGHNLAYPNLWNSLCQLAIWYVQSLLMNPVNSGNLDM